MLLGQVVAISVASNLFYLAILVASSVPSNPLQKTSTAAAPFRLWFPILISIATIFYSPRLTKTQYFLPNLLAMHGLITLPLFFPGSPPALDEPRNRFAIPLPAFYTSIALSSAVIRAPTVLIALSRAARSSPKTSIISALFTTLHAHPAQSSIGYDVVWTSASFLVWRVYSLGVESEQRGTRGVLHLLARTFGVVASAAGMLVASVGVVAPADLAVGGEVGSIHVRVEGDKEE